jgi:hypothetical protein
MMEKHADLGKLPKDDFLVIITKKNINTCHAMKDLTI